MRNIALIYNSESGYVISLKGRRDGWKYCTTKIFHWTNISCPTQILKWKLVHAVKVTLSSMESLAQPSSYIQSRKNYYHDIILELYMYRALQQQGYMCMIG